MTKTRTLLPLLLVAVLCGYTNKSAAEATNATGSDPAEKVNRLTHKFNKGVDRYFFRPVSKAYVAVAPTFVVTGFSNFADNLALPGESLNHLLQGKPKQSGQNLGRFAVNTTLGVAGFMDPASRMSIPKDETDFGETLHTWGFGEGAFVELPLYGASTTRDAVGVLVDVFTNPLTLTPTRAVSNTGLYADVVQRAGNRGRFADTVDSILYDSTDSYAQTKTIYLQNRRYELTDDNGPLDLYNSGTPDRLSLDPYEASYGE